MIRTTMLLALAALSCAAETPRPNIILINMDDLGYGDIQPFDPSCRNKTPQLNRMAQEGMRLTSFYAAPVCTPSRAQLLTGCYAKRVSLPNVIAPSAAVGIHAEEHTIGGLLRDLGYATMCIGKWHVGDQPEFLPTRRGFAHYLGIPYSNDMGGNPADDTAHGGNRNRYPPLPLVRDDVVQEILTPDDQSQIVARYTEAAKTFIRGVRDRPFFLYLAHTAVHVPLHPGPRFAGKSANGAYGDWVEESDASVGQILDLLRELKLEDHTLVVFTSDNGPWLAKGADGGSAGPLRGGKTSTFEGGVRVPTIVWWPGRILAGTSTDAITGNVDLLPTCVSLAGGSVPRDRRIDGHDIGPLLTGAARELPDRAWHYFSGDRLEAIRIGPWKCAIAPQVHAKKNIHGANGASEENRPFKPVLYHLDQDIGETVDLASSHPEVVGRIQALADAMDADLGRTGTGPGVRPPGRVGSPEPLRLK